MSLTIVIPYYKLRFLGEALESLAAQSDSRFKVWIGDDASPENCTDLIRSFQSRLELSYHRFDENWGGRSVVAQWNRCIRETKSDWVWLFSDDDTASPECVSAFHEVLSNTTRPLDVYRYQSRVIDEQGQPVRSSPEHPMLETAAELSVCRMLTFREFFIQNHIFSRASFDRSGGMVDLPCGLFSEDASFANMARTTGVATLPHGWVNWRQSEINLNAPRPELVDRKLFAFTQYVAWVDSTFGSEGRGFRRSLRVGAASWIRRSVRHMGGAPSRASRLKFYWFFLRFSPLRLPGVMRATRAAWGASRRP